MVLKNLGIIGITRISNLGGFFFLFRFILLYMEMTLIKFMYNFLNVIIPIVLNFLDLINHLYQLSIHYTTYIKKQKLSRQFTKYIFMSEYLQKLLLYKIVCSVILNFFKNTLS